MKWVTCFAWIALGGGSAAAQTVEQLGEELSTILSDKDMRKAIVGASVVDIETGESIYGMRAGDPFVPASTMKVLTAAAALDALGPSYSFSTDIYTDGEIEGTTLQGDLYLVGHADPTLVYERLWALLRDVRMDGVRTVQGDLIVDDSFLSEAPLIPGWDKPEDLREGPSYFPGIGALSMDFGAAVMVVRPGSRVGAPAFVELESPAPGYISIDNQLVTGNERSRQRVKVERKVLKDGSMQFRLEGSVPAEGRARRVRRAVSDPTLHFLSVAKNLLAQVGITVEGEVKAGVLPEEAERLRSLFSPPLSSILMDTNKYSSNFMAELVLRTLGAEKAGQGDTTAGMAQVEQYLTDHQIGLSSEEVLVNGSGLSRKARLTPQTLTSVLVERANDRMSGSEFMSSLAIAGQDGTLRRRLVDESGRVRAKTGTIDGVHCLAGYVDSRDGRRYAFAILVNEIRGSIQPVKGLQDEFLRRIMEWQAGG